MADIDLNAVVEAYVKLRDRKKDIEKAHKVEIAKIDGLLDQTDLFLMTHLNTVQSESVRTKAGTFFKSKVTSGTVASRETYLAWLQKTGEWDLADIRAAKANIAEYKAKHNDLPPGINWREEVVVNVRKGSSNGNKGNEEEGSADGGAAARVDG